MCQSNDLVFHQSVKQIKSETETNTVKIHSNIDYAKKGMDGV